jgi:hypothetical protein
MKLSPGFSTFRRLIDCWDEALEREEKEKNLHKLVNDQNLIMFFTNGEKLFGAPEESRVIFARMKSPDILNTLGDDTDFIAFDLAKAITGENGETLFNKENLNNIKIIDKEEIENLLLQHKGTNNVTVCPR